MNNENEETRNDLDDNLILSAQNEATTPNKPINEEVANGYNSADDTGNTADDLELNLSDDIDTDLDEDDINALNGLDIDDEETLS